MRYPSQLISSLYTSLDPVLVDFFLDNKDKYHFPITDLKDLINNILSEYLYKETNESKINEIYKSHKKLRHQKRTRLYNSMLKDNTSPFKKLNRQLDMLNNNEIKLLYNTTSREQIINSKKEAVGLWVKNSGYLIDYPLFLNYLNHSIFPNLKSDIFANLCNILIDDYNGDINSFYAKKPESLMDAPFFSSSVHSVNIAQDETPVEVFNSNQLSMAISVALSNSSSDVIEQKVRMFDNKDELLFIKAVNLFERNFYKDRSITTNLSTFVNCISKSKSPSSFYYDDVIRRLLNMGRINYTVREKDTDRIRLFHLFESVDISKVDGKRIVTLEFGNIVAQEIIKSKTITVPSSHYNSLENKISQLIYHALQRERILLDNNHSEIITNEYNYDFFRTHIFFTKSKNRNITKIKAALQEFIDKKIIIHSFKEHHNSFTINFYPLTQEERADLIYMKDHSITSN